MSFSYLNSNYCDDEAWEEWLTKVYTKSETYEKCCIVCFTKGQRLIADIWDVCECDTCDTCDTGDTGDTGKKDAVPRACELITEQIEKKYINQTNTALIHGRDVRHGFNVYACHSCVMDASKGATMPFICPCACGNSMRPRFLKNLFVGVADSE